MAGERVKRGYLGFVPQQLSDELARDLGLSVTSGIVVRQVIPESPALAAGLRARDVVLSIDDVPAVRVNRVLQRIAEIPPGKTVAVEVLRGQKRVRLSIKASVRPLGALEKSRFRPPTTKSRPPRTRPNTDGVRCRRQAPEKEGPPLRAALLVLRMPCGRRSTYSSSFACLAFISSISSLDFPNIFTSQMPSWKSTTRGTASSSCESASGGVKMAARMKAPTTT